MTRSEPASKGVTVGDLGWGEFAALRDENQRLTAENHRLSRLLQLTPQQAAPPAAAQAGMFDAAPGALTGASSPEDKVAFYMALFGARSDVYALRWSNDRTGKHGWVPAVRGGWRKDVPHADRSYLPLSGEVVTAHLRGDIHIGLYPLLDGDRCWWLAADFDGPAALLDALSYVKAARAVQVPVGLEVSRSGVGAHAWVFFTAPVPAETARRMGTGLLREAMAVRGHGMALTSYDRLFPSQDVLPIGGVGNLIAAPLQGRRRQEGATCFLDLGTLEPADDQWAFLSSLGRMTPREVATAAKAGSVAVGPAIRQVTRPVSTRTRPAAAPVVTAQLAAGIVIPTDDLTPALTATLQHLATMRNPEFDDRQRRRATTWGVPRFLRNWDMTPDGGLVLPRGLTDSVIRLIAQCGSRVVLNDERCLGSSQQLRFTGTLTPMQQAAAADVLPHDMGVLVAPPGSGKTVIGCHLAAARATSTLVLVDRKTLAEQWREKIRTLLGIHPGQIGGGRKKTTGVIDIALLQSLARHPDVESLTGGYGHVIVDECHHLPAAAYDHTVKQIPARYWLGLTATPYRRDRLDDLITLQLGPVRHTMARPTPPEANGQQRLSEDDRPPPPRPVLKVHTTGFCYTGDANPQAPGGMAAVYRDLVADQYRTRQVVADTLTALNDGRHCLVLTRWRAHVADLADALAAAGHQPVILQGGMTVKARTAALQRLTPSEGQPLLVVATSSLVGEGFDCPVLDTLFLAAPVTFKGLLEQHVGRILRPHPGKTTAVVHDYHDAATPVVAKSLSQRTAGYIKLGFPGPRSR